MKEEILNIAYSLKKGTINEQQARGLLLALLVTDFKQGERLTINTNSLRNEEVVVVDLSGNVPFCGSVNGNSFEDWIPIIDYSKRN